MDRVVEASETAGSSSELFKEKNLGEKRVYCHLAIIEENP
jgi:hypothetical protein